MRAGEILKSPQLSDSQTRQQKKAIDYELYFPPEEKKKSLLANKKKAQRRKDIKVKNKKLQEQVSFKSHFLDEEFVGILISALLSAGGIAVFAVGAILFNPVIWIIGLVAVVIGLLVVLIFTFYYLYFEGLVIMSMWWYLGFLLAGIILLIIGFVLNVLAMWVGGIVVVVAVIFFFLIRLFFMTVFNV